MLHRTLTLNELERLAYIEPTNQAAALALALRVYDDMPEIEELETQIYQLESEVDRLQSELDTAYD